jgi:hypothetical protein
VSSRKLKAVESFPYVLVLNNRCNCLVIENLEPG